MSLPLGSLVYISPNIGARDHLVVLSHAVGSTQLDTELAPPHRPHIDRPPIIQFALLRPHHPLLVLGGVARGLNYPYFRPV